METIAHSFRASLDAIQKLTLQGLNEIFDRGQVAALAAHAQIEVTPIAAKGHPLYRQLGPLQGGIIAVLAENYRKYLKLAFANPRETTAKPDEWALEQLQPAVREAIEWLHDWFALACDGENQNVRKTASVPFVPGQTVSIPIQLVVPSFPSREAWRAPAWLFSISPLSGIGPIESKDEPQTNSEEKLSAIHTHMILKGSEKVFLSQLAAEIDTVRNEEIAAAGAIPARAESREIRRTINRRGSEERLKLYEAIRKVLIANRDLKGLEFCAELDKRHAPPLYDWTKRDKKGRQLWREGLTWKEAWGDPVLKRRIRRVRQEAMKSLDRSS
jgi:hypothetical protein